MIATKVIRITKNQNFYFWTYIILMIDCLTQYIFIVFKYSQIIKKIKHIFVLLCTVFFKRLDLYNFF